MRFFLCALSLLLGALSAVSLHAQSYLSQEGPAPTVEDIIIRFGSLENVSTDVIRAQIQLREGTPYNQNLVDRSIRSLYATGLFDSIEATVQELSPSSVNVIFTVYSKYRLQEIRLTGNKRYSDRRLLGKTSLRTGMVLDERSVDTAARDILEYYRNKGFTNAKVDYDIQRNESTGLGAVTIRINEGPRLQIDRIYFEGNEAFSDRRLRRVMETSRYKWWLSWLTGSGRFDENLFAEDLEKVRNFYRNEGYLDVRISDDDVIIEERGKDIVLTVNVDEGRRYYVGNIDVEGEEIFDEIILTRSLRMIPGDVFSPEALDKDLETLRDYYGALGYLEARIRAERVPNLQTGNIDLIYQIEEGEQFQVESIVVEGNTKTKSVVILRELILRPGQVFNTVWMKNSEARLRNTRFFDEVTLSPEPTNVPQRRNLKVSVREGRTGQFQFGAGFSSLERAVFFVELSQGNFDLFNYRSFFQGDGQKFRFRAQIGSRSNEVVLNVEEPWLFEQRLALGTTLYRQESDYNSTLYDETRAGIQIYMRKPLFELVEGQLTYTLENVEIELNPFTGAIPEDILNEEGNRVVSKVGLALVRDTRNNLIFTTQGSRFTLTTEFAGLGGNTKYVMMDSRNALYLPTFETGEQVVAVLFRAGTIWPYAFDDSRTGIDRQDVPFFDRFFLGGPYSLRGFEYRDVSPRDDAYPSYPIGGNSYGFASVEYSIKVAKPLRLAVFYDWGFVNEDEFDFGPGTYNDNWGIGIRLLVLGNPLSLDYGIPITVSNYGGNLDNDEGGQFNFSFGTRF